MTTTTEAKLAAPGAGLPAIELFVARLLFALRRRMGNRDAFTDVQRRVHLLSTRPFARRTESASNT